LTFFVPKDQPPTEKKADPRSGIPLQKTSSSKTHASTLDNIRETVEHTAEWELAKQLYGADEFTDLPQ
jgi:hypothetical protein